ncbi:MAG: pirin family protein [Turicibacter sp.]
MLKKIDHTLLGTAYHTWLQSLFHFSLADYYQPVNKKYGIIRVINDDIMHPSGGHDLHKHREVEILTYVIEGELTHTYKGGIPNTLTAGHMYYMRAGTGIEHGEFNWSDTILRTLQIWIVPKERKQTPCVEYGLFEQKQFHNEWLKIGGIESEKVIFDINQEVAVWITKLDAFKHLTFEVEKNRKAYLIQIEGSSVINHIEFEARDGLEIEEEMLNIEAKTDSHFIVIEMKKDA